MVITYGLNLVGILAIIVGLAIVYRIFMRMIINMKGLGGFLAKVLFYIPCLLIDLLETLFAELKNSPKLVVVLFVLELLIILAYLYLPKLIRIIKPLNSKTLLEKPVFLTEENTIATGEDLKMPIIDVNNPEKIDNQFRKNYAISMWIYLNHHSTSYTAYSKETTIFRYGENGSNTGHPLITYFNDVKGGKPDQCIVYISNTNPATKMVTQLPAQSWNHLVINYNNSEIDLFLNGNLVNSLQLDSKSLPTFDIADVVKVGSGDNSVTNSGLMGAICNVSYHYRALLPIEIAASYNVKRYSNPPI
jgi:hypothetical protein